MLRIQAMARGQQSRRAADELYAASLHSRRIEYFLRTNKLLLARRMGWMPDEELRAVVVLQAHWRADRVRRKMAISLALAAHRRTPDERNHLLNIWEAVGSWLGGSK